MNRTHMKPDTQMNSKMDSASSNPKFNWDSADLVGEWKAFRQHVEFLLKGLLRTKNEEEQDYYDRFQAYVQPKSNPIFARHRLHSKIQKPGETVLQFITALKLLVKDCEYGQAEDDIVRDRIAFGKNIRQSA